MNALTTAPLSILRFWRDLEVFNIPTAPTAKDSSGQVKIVTLRRGDVLPWHHPHFQPTPEHGYVHVVYVGVADTEDLSRLTLQSVFPGEDLSERERQRATGNGWLAAFVANEYGQPKLDSYLPASFAQGVDALLHSEPLENVNARLARATEEFAQRRHQLRSVAADAPQVQPSEQPPPGPLTWNDLDEELHTVRKLLGPSTDGKKKPFGKALSTFLGTPIAVEQRIDILNNHVVMGELVSVAHLPSARWPASPDTPLVLAQQAAVAQVLNTLGRDGGTLGINGPPGTGKTTLLCDVIAEVVTERARKIAALSRPIELFEESLSVAGKNFFPLKVKVVGGSAIVVTSTNNNAVKNITQELPAREKVHSEFASATYFDEVIREVFAAQKVVDDEKQPIECWGLVAAALGNAGNRRSFARGFFRDEPRQAPNAETPSYSSDRGASAASAAAQTTAPSACDPLPPSIKQLLEAASNDYARYQAEWHTAKKSFLALLSDFEAYRSVLLQAEKAAQQIDACQQSVNAQRDAEQTQAQAVDKTSRHLTQIQDNKAIQHALVDSRRATLDQARSQCLPNLWDKLCALFGQDTERMKALRATLIEPTKALAQATEALAQLAQDAAMAGARLEQQREAHRLQVLALQRTEYELQGHHRALKAGYDTGARYFVDSSFWQLPADQRHRASVAVSPALDKLRARIFLQAMELHRLTVLANAGKFIGNLRSVSGMLTGSLRDKLPLEQRPLLWDALFFVVPVVSTTLASFDRLFAGMGQDSLGWLLIDEAGQATPQSAAGAIWRSQRAVLVGDPLQIEPVFTVPLMLVEEFRRRHALDPMWSPNTESVQTLADRITRHGSWVAPQVSSGTIDAEKAQPIWTGMPLRTHRRCDDPMFKVANRIAYAEQMVHGRVGDQGQPEKTEFTCVLGDSVWLDVRATRTSHPVIEDELDVLVDCLLQLQQEPAFTPARKAGARDKVAKIFVISPFRKLKNACINRIKDAGLGQIECGTVHTFQGKEAEIVFLVLGTAPGQAGAGARAWASGKPNLLNVAITRAKHRLYVIGDAAQWGGLSHFSELHQALPIRIPLRSETGIGSATKSS